jgi:dTDP-4-amino-4,6-dideoxygalactose transaminase
MGKEEVEALRKVIESGKPFRYMEGGECVRFEKRYAEWLGAKHVFMTSSGTASLTALLAGMGIGPGDEVIVPAHTYIATAVAPLAVGAIPVIVDVDASIGMDPAALDDAIGPRTKVAIPVHMWGTVCNLDAILAVARKRGIRIVEDACQCVGGAYHGRKVGTLGTAGAFSFNYYKNMSCGEGGAFVTDDDKLADLARCHVDCNSFYWNGPDKEYPYFVASGSRASEFEGAIMNVQLDRLPDMIGKLRALKKDLVKRAAALPGLAHAPINDLDGECCSTLLFQLPTATKALAFAKAAGGGVASDTGRHTYTNWDPILKHRGAHHPALNPFLMPQNQGCRMDYRLDMCAKSLRILERTVLMGLHPDLTPQQVSDLLARLETGAKAAQGA